MTGRQELPIEWLEARIERSDRSPTGFIWKSRPLEDFQNNREWGMWNSTNAGKTAGTFPKKAAPFVSIRRNGRAYQIDIRALDIAFRTRTWPTVAELRALPRFTLSTSAIGLATKRRANIGLERRGWYRRPGHPIDAIFRPKLPTKGASVPDADQPPG
jgi:hypothetical protein